MAGFLECKETTDFYEDLNQHLVNKNNDVIDGLNDNNYDDFEIPANDIYCQEFFFFGYSHLSKERKNFFESHEGFTYIKCNSEYKQTQKVMQYLYNELPRDVEKWAKRIKSRVKKIKVNKLDDNETDFIDVDLVLSYYMEEYREVRKKVIQKLIK